MPRKAYSSSYSDSSTSSYETIDDDDDDDDDDDSNEDLFKEAEEMIKSNLAKLFNVGSNCGIRTDRRGRVLDDPSDEPVRPSWRKDPRKSFSDWKLVVRDGSTSKIYHLHKGVLAHGPRSSRFFVREFEEYHNIGSSHRRDAATSGGGNGNKARAVTEVALPKRSAVLLPTLLDFIYDDKLDLTSANAPPIRHLANHFDVRMLYTLVSSFIQKDLRTASTAPIYVQQADLVNDKELLSMATETTARNLQTAKDTDLVTVPPRLLPQILSHPSAFYPSSEWLSELIARYVRGRGRLEKKHRQLEERRERHRRQVHQQQQSSRNKNKPLPPPPPPSEPFEVITDETFYFLTHAQILPRIAPSEAMWYLTFTKETYGEDVLADESMGGKEGSLKRRCVLAVSRDWRWMLVGPLRYDRVHNHNGSNAAAGGSDADTKRRLFVEGEGEDDSEQLKVYKSLPVDLRLEMLEESLLNAADNNHNNNNGGQQGPLQTPPRPSSSSHPQHPPPQPLQSPGTPVSLSSMSSRQPPLQPPPQLQPLPTTPHSAPPSPHNVIMPSMHNTQQIAPPPPPHTQHTLTPPPPPPTTQMEFEKRGDSERRREYQHTAMRESDEVLSEKNDTMGQTATLSSSEQKRLNREMSEGGRRTFMV